MKRLILKALILSLFLSCSTEESVNDIKSIIGLDDRSAYQDGTMGHLVFEGKVLCTAIPIGPKSILTPRHCLSDIPLENSRFIQNDLAYSFKVVKENIEADLSWLNIEVDLPHYYSMASDVNLKEGEFAIIGKMVEGNDYFSAEHETVSELEDYPGFARHTFDTTKGTSGSGIFLNGLLVGIHLGALKDQSSNLTVIISRLNQIEAIPEFIPEGCSWRNPRGCIDHIIPTPPLNNPPNPGFIPSGLLPCPTPSIAALGITFYDSYKKKMDREGSSVGIPACVRNVIAQNYSFDPNWIEMRRGVQSVPPAMAAITLENKVFFRSNIRFDSAEDIHLLLHELAHVEQWKSKGKTKFISEYICKSSVTALQHEPMKVHDMLNEERSADRKADIIFDQALDACSLNTNDLFARDIGHSWMITHSFTNGSNFPIYAQNQGDRRWIRKPGLAVRIGGNQVNPMVVNAEQQIFEFINNDWRGVPGYARDVGENWIIGAKAKTAHDFAIYRRNARGTWDEMPGYGIAIGGSYQFPFVLNSSQDIYAWTGAGWRHLPGKAHDIGSGWVVGTNHINNGNFGIFRWNELAKRWDSMPGQGVRIGGSFQEPWIIDAQGRVYKWTGNLFKRM